MSRTPTPDELRAIYAELKRQGLSRYDYDELVRIDNQGRLLMSCDVADAQRPASQAIKATFKRLAAFQIVALNKLTTGDNWLSTGSKNDKGPFTWAIYLEIDDDTSHPDIFLDGYDAVLEYIPELDSILDVARQNGVDIAKTNVHADIRGKNKIKECDGGGAAAGGDAGGAVGGDAGGAAAGAGDAGGAISVAEPVGTTNTDVLGKCDHKCDGYFGPGCFHAPSKVQVPLYRWQVANGGSKRKKYKNGKDKHYAYEKDMKVVVNMFEEEKDGRAPKLNKGKVLSRMKSMSKRIKSMDDVRAVEARAERGKDKVESLFSGAKYSQVKQMFYDLYGFIKDICTGKYKASWFAVTVVAVGLLYVLLPIDVIPDAIPIVGIIDDAFALKFVYDAVKDELDAWKAAQKK